MRTNVDLKDKYRTLRKNGTIDLGDREDGWRKDAGRKYSAVNKLSAGVVEAPVVKEDSSSD